jgi:hypothetical protein
MLTPRLTRRRLAGCTFLAFLALAGAAWWTAGPVYPPGSGFDRVRLGMTYEQVERLVGHPNRTEDYRNGDGFVCHRYVWSYREQADIVLEFHAGTGLFAIDNRRTPLRDRIYYWWDRQFGKPPPRWLAPSPAPPRRRLPGY